MELSLCWKCGHPLEENRVPPGFRDECPACSKSLHVCKQCLFYDPSKNNQCREPTAERVVDKTRANFCDLFRFNPNAYTQNQDFPETSKHALEALFGEPASKEPSSKNAYEKLNDLFK